MRLFALALVVLSVLVLANCKETASVKIASTQSAQAPNSQKKVTKLTFVGQKDACACTRERIDKSWEVLASIVAQLESKPQIEHIQRDVDKARADELHTLAAVMVAPGLYLFDENGSLIALLQGELSPDQLRKSLR